MKGLLTWLLISVIILILAVIAALLIIPRFIDTAQFKTPVERYVSKATNRPVSIGDDIKVSLFPWVGLAFSNFQIGNDTGFDDKNFLKVDAAEARVKLLPLLSRRVMIDRIIIDKPHVCLITDKDGRVNWSFAKETVQPKTPKTSDASSRDKLPIAALMVEKIRVTNGLVTITDHRNATHREISGINLALDNVSFDQPIGVALSAVTDQMPISINGHFGPVGDPPGITSIPLNLQIEILDQVKAHAKGMLENVLDSPAADIELEVAEFSLRTLAGRLKRDLPQTADPEVLQNLKLTTRIKATEDSLALNNGVLVLDESTLNFTFTAREFSIPDLTFNLRIDRFNADRYLPPTETEKDKKKDSAPSTDTSGTKNDYAPIRKIVLNGKVEIGKLIVNNLTIDKTQFTIKGRQGIVTLDPLNVSLYQGTVNGKAVMSFMGANPTTDLQLAVDGLQVAPLLKDVDDIDVLEGTIQARLKLEMRGNDAASIKQSLEGNGNINSTDCAIIGVDLTAIAKDPKKALEDNAATGRKARTEITELTAPFTIQNGILTTTGTSIKSEQLHMLASGTVDLVREKLDLLMEPKVIKQRRRDPSKIKTRVLVPIKVSGTFDKPVFSVDIKNLATNKLLEKLGEDDSELKQQAGELIKSILGGE